MPFKSKAQVRAFYAKEESGEMPKGTAKRWARHTPNIKSLPEHVKKSSIGEIIEDGCIKIASLINLK